MKNNNSTGNSKIIKILLILLWCGVVLSGIKSIFTDTGYDNSYMVAMSFRHISGDLMFQTMWEPHQTSIFVTDLLMLVYRIFVPDFTGVVLYLQICGTLLYALIAFLLYKSIKNISGSTIAQLSCIFLLLFKVKQSPFLDYANLEIAFSIMTFICLINYLQNQTSIIHLVFAGIFTCLTVLSYPSCIILYIAVIIILILYSEKKVFNSLLLTGICAFIGLCYAGYFAIRIGIKQFTENLQNIVNADTHAADVPTIFDLTLLQYFKTFLLSVLWIAICFLIAKIIHFTISLIFRKKLDILVLFGLILLLSNTGLLFLQRKLEIDWTIIYFILPMFMMFLSLFTYKFMNNKEKIIWISGIVISISIFISTLLLTDLPLLTISAYLVLGGTVSITSLRYLKGNAILFLIILCGLIAVHRGLIIWGYANNYGVYLLYEADSYIHSGPAKGIICAEENAVMSRDDMEDHSQYINSDDKVLFLSGWIMDSIEFMISGGEIANFSTIDTPFYNECLEKYYEIYPQKFPTVVAVECHYGTMYLDESSYAVNWLNNYFEPVGEGRYWKYYRAKK